MTPEEEFTSSTSLASRRALGQFFTPWPVALLMADWVCGKELLSILDPSCGPGILARAVSAVSHARTSAAIVTCMDLDPLALEVASRNMPVSASIRIQQGDFLACDFQGGFDAVIANPPYLRRHAAACSPEMLGSIARRAGVHVPRTANAYMLFLLHAASLLRPGGRMSFLVPSEWWNADFGQPLKEFLLRDGFLRRVACFDRRSAVFTDAMTTSCILFMESTTDSQLHDTSKASESVLVYRIPAGQDMDALSSLSALEACAPAVALHHSSLRMKDKWDAIIRGEEVHVPSSFVALGTMATSQRGMVTGANSFFHIPRGQMDALGLHGVPCVGHARDVTGLIWTVGDMDALSTSARPSRLVVIGDEMTDADRCYVREGEAAGLPARYILSRRRPWHTVEGHLPAPIWAAVFSRKRIKFILNECGASHLTTFHGLYPCLSPEFTPAIAAVLNATSVQELVRARARPYGGGLMKLEPRDLLGIPVPNVALLASKDVADLHDALRDLSAALVEAKPEGSAQAALDAIVDRVFLTISTTSSLPLWGDSSVVTGSLKRDGQSGSQPSPAIIFPH